MKKYFVVLLLALAFCSPAIAQEEPEPPRVANDSTKVGPVEFHVIPELGAGIFLQDDQTIEFDGTDAFFIIRIPGLIFPGWNQTVTGVQVELSEAPIGAGVRYSIVSYTRTKIAGPAYTGANVRLAQGASDVGAELAARVMPIVGIKMWTVAEHVPFFLEVEFFDNNRPIKASLIITWE